MLKSKNLFPFEPDVKTGHEFYRVLDHEKASDHLDRDSLTSLMNTWHANFYNMSDRVRGTILASMSSNRVLCNFVAMLISYQLNTTRKSL